MIRQISFFLLFASSLRFSQGTFDRGQESQVLRIILDKEKYDPRLRAYGNTSSEVKIESTSAYATVVSVNLFVRSIQSIDDIATNYKTQLTFRMQWLDKRLSYEQIKISGQTYNAPYLTLNTPSAIWTPDLFFSNELEAHSHNLLKPNLYLRIFPDGQVLYSTRLSLTLSCPMVLKLFPMDTQTCSMRMASYGFTTQDIIFKWKATDPVQVTKDLHLPKFALEQFTTDYCDSHTNTGVYSCLRVDFGFKRIFGHYLRQVYIPTIMFVIVAYISFWIAQKETKIMVSLLSLFVLAMGTLAINTFIPASSYTKAVDVWTGVCLTFVFAALVTNVVDNFFREPSSDRKLKNDQSQKVATETTQNQENNVDGKHNILGKYKSVPLSTKINVFARVVYPIVFIIFYCVYALAYKR